MVTFFVGQAQGINLLLKSPSLIDTEMGRVEVDSSAFFLVSELLEEALAFVLGNGVVNVLTLFLDQKTLHVEKATVGHC